MSVSLNSVGVANFRNKLIGVTHSFRGSSEHTTLIEFEVTFATNLAILIIITVLMVNSRKLADRIGCDEYEMATNGSVRDNP